MTLKKEKVNHFDLFPLKKSNILTKADQPHTKTYYNGVRHLIIKAARKAAKLSIPEWALYMHKSESTVKSWEREDGSEPNTMHDHARVCKRLNIPPEVYMFGNEKTQQIKPHHLQVISLFDHLTSKQRKILLELMEEMVN